MDVVREDMPLVGVREESEDKERWRDDLLWQLQEKYC